MMTILHPTIADVTDRIRHRSRETRAAYLELIRSRRPDGFARMKMTEGNLAHASAGCAVMEKSELLGGGWPNIGIITSYNDMLSAHAPFEGYPDIIRRAAREVGAIAQVAGGVPAMCDGVTQGQEGMELSLFSRDVIAMSSAIGLSHDVFDAALHLGVCDKIVPGLVIAALRFGWIPSVFVPAGPMPSGLPNPEKVRIRQLFAEGKVGREELLRAEAESYHTQGTCTFYGTANSNQMLMEVMGFHLPGAAFTNPGTPLREALTRAATARAGWGTDRRAVHRQRDCRPHGDGRLNQPRASHSGDGSRRRYSGVTGRLCRHQRRHAAIGPHLSKRAFRREPFPCCGRDEFSRQGTSRRGPHAWRC